MEGMTAATSVMGLVNKIPMFNGNSTDLPVNQFIEQNPSYLISRITRKNLEFKNLLTPRDNTLDEYLCTSPQEITETPTCSRPPSSASTISMERSARRKLTLNADVGVEALFTKATNALSSTVEDTHR
ncbi:hypothetical protein CBL_08473 [Carabus blaptoides fortunei]